MTGWHEHRTLGLKQERGLQASRQVFFAATVIVTAIAVFAVVGGGALLGAALLR